MLQSDQWVEIFFLKGSYAFSIREAEIIDDSERSNGIDDGAQGLGGE
jgi:hypothetical protein